MEIVSNGMIIVLVLSIGLNLVFYYIGIHPVLMKKILRDDYLQQINVEEYKAKILDAGLNMAASERTLMPLGDYSSFLVELRKIINMYERKCFNYSFPKAYLMNGLLDYAVSRNDMQLINKVTDIFRKYHEEDGTLRFALNKVDQAPFGLSFIVLHQIHGDFKYKKGADQIYQYLKDSQRKDNKLILYREGDNRQFVDVLGMIIPFLIKYGITYNDATALDIAYSQIIFYIDNGLEEHTGLPFHAFSLDVDLRLGPANWGRGIGWYAIALAYVVHYTNSGNNRHYVTICNEMDRLHKHLITLRSDGSWGQFVQAGRNDRIDTSTTTLYLYAFGLAGNESTSESELLRLLGRYTTIDGYLDYTSGDTYTINRYAVEYGKSELSQGLLLSLFGLAVNLRTKF